MLRTCEKLYGDVGLAEMYGMLDWLELVGVLSWLIAQQLAPAFLF